MLIYWYKEEYLGGQCNIMSIQQNLPLGSVTCSAMGSWPHITILSCGVGLQSNHEAAGYSQNTCVTFALMGISWQTSHRYISQLGETDVDFSLLTQKLLVQYKLAVGEEGSKLVLT